MPEVLFYHLQRQPLESVLPLLLEKTLERGWKAVVRVGSPERLAALDEALWTYREDSFLPHGTKADGAPETQPIYLTSGDERPNDAECVFVTDGAVVPLDEDCTRIVLLFDGHDEDAVGRARETWKDAKARGLAATYWQQDEDGRWQKKA
jgi:DNA polymerase-3 subunit chi